MLLLNLNQLLIVIIKLPRVNPQWGNLDNAILTIEKLLSLFSKGSEGYNRFAIFLKIFKTAPLPYAVAVATHSIARGEGGMK